LRRRFVSAVIGTLLLAACGEAQCGGAPSSSAPKSTAAASHISCSDASAPHHAYVVVQHMSGSWIQACVGFAPDYLDGQTLMDRSGIQYVAQPDGSARVACRIDGEPTKIGACATQEHDTQAHWALFVEARGRWSKATSDFAGLEVFDSDVMGWRFVPAGTTTPAPPPQPRELAS
jgi:hypothetical protein